MAGEGGVGERAADEHRVSGPVPCAVCRLSTKVPWPSSSSRSSTRRTCVPSSDVPAGMALTLVTSGGALRDGRRSLADHCRCPPLG